MSSKKLIELSCIEARAYFLKNSSYFNSDLPKYINFEPLLNQVSTVMNGNGFEFKDFKNDLNPKSLENVNYKLIANKDGKIAWRPLELIHPVIYVSLINLICKKANWEFITKRMRAFEGGVVKCCSIPVVSSSRQSDKALQISSWWQKIEQQSLKYSLEFSHILHTDVTDCYGSLYTHSIPWALHGKAEAKENRKNSLGNSIDRHLQAGRYGQTNGISQGSVLMDFIAEIVLGYVDEQINAALSQSGNDFRVLRYRDDYRIFSNNDDRAEVVLKIISDSLLSVGMRLGTSKTYTSKNVVSGSVKPDKLAAIGLQDLGGKNAKTIQKQLLMLHSFGQQFPNSGALKRLLTDFRTKVAGEKDGFHDLEVQVAIATDIAFTSPSALPAVAAILSHLISKAPIEEKRVLWDMVSKKLHRVPYNGYLEIWLQRVILPSSIDFGYESDELICKIVNGEDVQLWDCTWINSEELNKALRSSQIVVSDPRALTEVMEPNEFELFSNNYDY
jgi:RNA-directed DNA polymerase